jgi:RHS repeat-associated protein
MSQKPPVRKSLFRRARRSSRKRGPDLSRIRHWNFRLEYLEDRIAPATVNWTNPNGGNWDVGSNWSSGSVPGSSDDAVINTASAASILIQNGDAESVHSLTTAANDTLSITGGSLTSAGDSTMSGPLTMTGGSLIASGSGVTITASGTTNVTAANLIAQAGATLSLPKLTTYTGPISFATGLLEGTGAGSTLSLPNLTTLNASTAESSAVQFSALAGGTLDLSGLSQISGGAVGLEADGANSVLDVSSLTSFSKSPTNFSSGLQVTNHGTLLDPKLTSLSALNLALDGTGSLSTDQITSYTGGSFTLTGGTLSLKNLSDFDDSSVTVSGGASLSFPVLTGYAGPNGFGTTVLQATGTGSSLSLAQLTTLSASAVESSLVQFSALSGGSVDLSALPQISGGAVGLTSDGANSVLNLSALASFSKSPTNFGSALQVTNHGTALDPKLTTMSSVDLTLDGTGTLSTDQLTSITNGTFALSGGSLTLNVSDVDTENIIVSGGATLNLPAVKSSTGPSGFGSVGGLLQATGTGSTLSLASLTTLNASNVLSSSIEFEALAGGKLDVSELPQIAGGAVVLVADGAGSVLNVSALTSFSKSPENYNSSVQVTNHGTLLDPKLTSLNTVELDLDGTGTWNSNQITSFLNGGLNLPGGTVSLTGLTNIAGSAFTVTNSGVLNLGAAAGVSGSGSTLTMGGGGTVRFSTATAQVPAPGSGVTISIPQLPSGITFFVQNTGTYSGATMNVGQGDQVFLYEGSYTGGIAFSVAAGAVVDLTDGNAVSYSGTVSGSGGGTVQLSGGALAVAAGGLTLNFTGNIFQWLGGGINSALGDVTNRGTMNLSGSNEKVFYNDGTLDNFGTIIQTGTGNFGLHSDNVTATTLKMEAGGSYLIQSDSGIDNPFGGVVAVINAGTISKTGGTGTSTLNINGTLSNTGTIEAASGKLVLAPVSSSQVSGGTLTAGTWEALSGATLSLPSGTAITTSAAILGLSGAGATITGIAGLNANAGTLSIGGGATFTTAAALNNTGALTLGPAGTLTVQGAYTQSSGATLNEQIGGTPTSGQFGQLVVKGAASLAGTFNLSVVNGFTPSAGQSFQVVTFNSASGNFGTYTGLGSNFTSTLTATGLVLSVSGGKVSVVPTSVTAPASATAGLPITVTWQVQDQSGQAATGNWLDSVYLSKTPSVNSGSILLGTVQHSGGLAANGTYTGTLTAAVPATAIGNHYVIVQVDSLYQLPESNRASTTLAASGQLGVTLPALTLGTPHNDSFTASDQDRYYQITVPTTGTLVLSLASAASSGALALYVNTGVLPTAYSYGEAANVPGQPKQTLTLADVAAGGTVYVLVHSVAGAAATSPFTLTVTETNALTLLAPPEPYGGGNGGNLTIPITGTNLSRAATVSISNGGKPINATSIYDAPSGALYATFNLQGLSAGIYSLTVQQGSQTATAPAYLNVIAAPVLAPHVSLTVPSLVSAGRDGVAYVQVENLGLNDVLAPLLELTADGATLKLPDQREFQGASVWFLAPSPLGPAGILRPGQTVEIPVQFQSVTTNPTINFQLNIADDSQPMNWAAQEQALQIPTIPNAAWPIVFSNFVANMGNTVESYHAVLAADATYLGQFADTNNGFDQLVDILPLVEFEIEKANAAYTAQTLQTVTAADLPAPGFDLTFQQSYLASISGRYYQGILGQGWVSNWDISASTTSNGDAAIKINGSSYFFFLQANGSYLPATGEQGEALTQSGGGYRLQLANGFVYQFNPNGTLAYVEDANGYRVTAGYNAHGQLAQLTDSNGEYLKLTYNPQGQLATLTDSNGRTATYGYTGPFLTSYGDVFGTTTYTYVAGGTPAQNGALSQIAFADNTHVFFTYDTLGRLIDQHRDGGVEDEQFGYLTPGGVVTTDADGNKTTNLFDSSGATGETIDGVGNATLYQYDANFNLVRVVTSDGATYSYSYDANGNLASVSDPLGNHSGFAYNANNDLTGFTDAKGNTTSYGYNAENNLLSVTYADGTSAQQSYNPLGEASQFTNARGQTVGYLYNAQGLVKQELFADGTSYSFGYNALGEMTSATDAQGHTTTFVYGDAANPTLLTEVDYPDGTFLKFKYNVVGRRTQSLDQTGFTINYGYDPLGRLSKLTDASGNLIVQYTYDPAGNLKQKDLGNGTRTVYTYDADNRILSITNYAPDHATVNSFDIYTYDSPGNVATDTNQDGEWVYGYNADNELTSGVFTPNAKDPDGLSAESLQYAYDAAGNRVSEAINGVVTSYQVNNVNQYTSSTTPGAGTTTYQYDLDGNLMSATSGAQSTTYTYNVFNELTGVSGPGLGASYAYDPLGNVVSETLNGATTNFQVDPTGLANIVAAFSGAGVYNNSGGLTSHYIYGLGLASQVNAAGSSSYYDFGLNGSTVGITGSAGTYVNQYAYQPFGGTTTLKASVTNPFTFVGLFGVADYGTGLISMRARTYNPATGQFTSNDPLGLSGGSLNVRAYVGNSPVDGVDPTGTCPPKPGYHPPPPQKFLGVQPNAWGGQELHYQGSYFGPFYLGDSVYPVSSQDNSYYYYDGNGTDGFYQSKSGDPSNSSTGPGGGGGCSCGCPPSSPPGAGTIAGPGGSTDNNTPHDPNALIGPAGYGAQGFIQPGGAWSYTVDFENDGSAPALDVTVTQQLDPNLDWSTFQLGSFGFGSMSVIIPPGLTQYQTTVAYKNSDGTPLNVQVAINFNVQTGLLTATFTSLDPNTSEAPTGSADGFLPPDNSSHVGEGFVGYTIQPKSGLTTGAAINQRASVVFDTEASLNTDPALNTIDIGPVTSSVNTLPAITNGVNFTVSWSGSDNGGSGIASYTIDVSVNGGPFTPWLINTTQTSASYTGVVGDTYSFYSVAADHVGNEQPMPTTAQATTKVEALQAGANTLVAIPVKGSDELFAITTNHGLYFYTSAVGWQQIGAAGTIQSISGVADASGNPVIFVVTTDAALFRFSPASGWQQIGGSGTIRSISAGTDAKGQPNVFVLTAGNAFFEYSQAGWAQIGAANTILSMNAASQGRVVVITADESVFEFGPGSGWIRLTSAGFAKSLSVVTEAAGGLVVFAVTQNDALYRETLTSGWQALGAAGTIQAIDAGTDTHGNANVFALTAADSFFRYNSAGWAPLGAAHTILGMEAADSDRVFAITADGSLFANDDAFGWYRLTGSGFISQ